MKHYSKYNYVVIDVQGSCHKSILLMLIKYCTLNEQKWQTNVATYNNA